jgi:ribonuclease BN (tRNA processing enzyme)
MLRAVCSLVVFFAVGQTITAQPCRGGTMSVQVLGSGDPFVNPHRASSSYILWLGGRNRILVDAGGGAFLRFGQAEARLADLSLILISHLHPDHVSDLPALLWLSNLARKDSLPIIGPDANDAVPSISTFLRRLFDPQQGAFPMLGGTLRGAGGGVPLDITVVGAANDPRSAVFAGNGMTVSAVPVPHAKVPSIAYRVQTADGSVVFGSDQSGDDARFAEFARDADILVMHLTAGVGQNIPGHASPAVVGEVALAARARRLVLSHIGQFDVNAAVADIRKRYRGAVSIAADLQCFGV